MIYKSDDDQTINEIEILNYINNPSTDMGEG